MVALGAIDPPLRGFIMTQPLVPLIATGLLTLAFLIINRNSLLIALLTLEIVILTLLIIYITLNPSTSRPLLVLLTIGAAEASLGLSLLALITRFYGSSLLSFLRTQ